MSLMSKLLMSTIAATVTLSATVSDDTLVKYFKKFIVKNPSVEVRGVEVLDVVKIPDHPGWEAYLTTMKLRYNNQDVSAPQTIFANGTLLSPMLVDSSKGIDYSKELKPKVSLSLYNTAHLLFGNKNAQHKILIFSDPQCPFCMEIVPDVMRVVKEYPELFALYYYHLPLVAIHPVSAILVRVMHVAQEKGQNDIVEKLYGLKVDPNETNEDKVLAAVKAQTGFVITKEEINTQSVKDAIKADEDASAKMMVTGTPTIFIDGEWDKMRDRYKTFLPQK